MSVGQRALREEVGGGLFTRGRIVPIGLGLLSLLLLFLIVHDVFLPPASPAASVTPVSVTRGTVRSAVSGTGTVTPMQQQGVNFAVGGTLAEVDVKVGDKVTRGQTLAKLDPTQLQQSLDQANNGLTTAQAQLSSTVNGNTIQQAQHSLANAQQSLADTQAQVNLTNGQDQAQLQADTDQLGKDTAAANDLQPALDQQTSDQSFKTGSCGPSAPTPLPARCSTIDQEIAADNQRVQRDQAASNAISADNQKILQDNNRIASDKLSGQRSINQATNQVTTAQDQLNSQTIQRPNTVSSQQASVSNAQLSVATAQRNLNFATLAAPFDGTVLAVNAQPGDSVSGGGSASSASSSSSGSGSTGGTGGTGGSSSSSTSSSSSSGFIVLGDLSGFQIVTPFAEADAARVQPNQQATVTFDAITGLTLTAHVTSVAQTATVVSNVVNYNATLVLDQVDQRLKSGMTANASVVVQQAQNVLVLPNNVITRIGGVAFVTLLGRDGKTETRQAVQTGAVGDTSTEIVSGVNEGDRVVRPQLRTTTTTGAGAAGGAGGRGGFGGGGGGGGVRIGG